MMDRQTAQSALDVFTALGFRARRRAFSEREQWIELLSADEKRVIRTFEIPHDIAVYLRLPNRDFATHAERIKTERAEIALSGGASYEV